MVNRKTADKFYYGAIIFYALLILFIVAGSGVMGVRFFSAQGNSMDPSIKEGFFMCVVPQNNYHVGDAIIFTSHNNPSLLTTHRILHDNKTSFITKGDNNNATDKEYVHVSQIVGKVVFNIPLLGGVYIFLKSFLGTMLFFYVPAAFFLFIEGKRITRNLF